MSNSSPKKSTLHEVTRFHYSDPGSHTIRTVFLCHASEDKTAAERIQLALASAGYKVFFDESLPPGGDYHARIREAIRECDIFIFLISTSSVAQGKFTLTELKFARERWPSPVGRVLPVNLDNLSTTEIPAYLTATTECSWLPVIWRQKSGPLQRRCYPATTRRSLSGPCCRHSADHLGARRWCVAFSVSRTKPQPPVPRRAAMRATCDPTAKR